MLVVRWITDSGDEDDEDAEGERGMDEDDGAKDADESIISPGRLLTWKVPPLGTPNSCL